jgi:dihydrofolate reductase
MGKVKVAAFSLSIDGFAAGPDQGLTDPLGRGGMAVHNWMFPTRTFRAMTGQDGGEAGPDDDLASQSMQGVGAWIMGRNMFGPIRGPWPDDAWRGWWGETPPYHVPVFVLTHHPRPALAMQGGTVFHFITDGIAAALDAARQAAGDKDIRIGGGAATVRQYLQAGLVDEMHLAISPVLLGRGEAPLAGLDLTALGLRVARHVATPLALHTILRKD